MATMKLEDHIRQM